ncbi:MAG: TauD/TfdA family dioxygenase [Alphaproteobacteria bacterium]|nr:TauD/TfdA family dioxygenase [Alphaproteobacteria bacterium]MCB9929738.1 TauD/TfdA family dioxygenase [Alphaproteobacteria bacterium]
MRNDYQHITVSPIAGSLGAEIGNVDLAADNPEGVYTEIHRALLENLVIFFRDQDITPDRQLAFARRWGDLHQHPFMKGMEDYPDILEIKKLPTDKKNFGGGWHSDQMFAPKPAMGTILLARETPAAGGDTLFANMYAAYDALSDGMKAMLNGLKAVSAGDNFKQDGGKSRREVYGQYHTMQVREPPTTEKTTNAHPVVRTHPETGRKALYAGGHWRHFEGMTEAESAPLMAYLREHSTRPEFTCRFRWRPGSMAFWDNRCTQHFAIDDYPGQTRIMHRITVCGDEPF